MSLRLALCAGGFFLLSAATLFGGEATSAENYGSGVHAFFSQDYQQAHESLTAAVDAKTEDPRCYYFRGLTLLKLGQPEEANVDFAKGAELETSDVNRFYNVPQSLERVQGKDRLLLETFRAKGRLIALKRKQELRAQRYGEIRRQESRILLRQVEEAEETVAEGGSDPFDVPFGVSGLNPLSTPPAETTSESPVPAPIADMPAPAADDDPFAAAPEPVAPAPVSDDPFATGAAAPVAPAPIAPADDDPFAVGADTPAVEEATEPVAPAVDDDPFAGEDLGTGDGSAVFDAIGDLLGGMSGGGDDTEEGVEDAPADETIEETEDPFGEDPFGADPFGE